VSNAATLRPPRFERDAEDAWARWRRGAFATFLVHLGLTALALPAASAVTSGVRRVAGEHPRGVNGWSSEATVDIVVEAMAAAGAEVFVDLAFMGGLALLLSVPVQMVWLTAMREPLTPKALGRAMLKTPTAWMVSLLLVPAWLLGAGVLVGCGWAAHAIFEGPNPRTHDLAVLVSLLPGIALWVSWGAWHDLARASVAEDAASAFDAARRGWRALRPALGEYVTWQLVAASVVVLGWWTSGLGSATLVLFATQTVALGRTFVRARWLASATLRVR